MSLVNLEIIVPRSIENRRNSPLLRFHSIRESGRRSWQGCRPRHPREYREKGFLNFATSRKRGLREGTEEEWSFYGK